MLTHMQLLYLLAAALFCAIVAIRAARKRSLFSLAVPALMALSCAYSAFAEDTPGVNLQNAGYMNYFAVFLLALTVLPPYFQRRPSEDKLDDSPEQS